MVLGVYYLVEDWQFFFHFLCFWMATICHTVSLSVFRTTQTHYCLTPTCCKSFFCFLFMIYVMESWKVSFFAFLFLFLFFKSYKITIFSINESNKKKFSSTLHKTYCKIVWENLKPFPSRFNFLSLCTQQKKIL